MRNMRGVRKRQRYFGFLSNREYWVAGLSILVILIAAFMANIGNVDDNAELSPRSSGDVGFFSIGFLRLFGLGVDYESADCEDLMIYVIKDDGAKRACEELESRNNCEDTKSDLCVLCMGKGIEFEGEESGWCSKI
jgi:hypothetical protein